MDYGQVWFKKRKNQHDLDDRKTWVWKSNSKEKGSPVNTLCWNICVSDAKKVNIDQFLKLYTKINSKSFRHKFKICNYKISVI